ncbi:DUF1311 domain-containing protein [Alphaproteobacteria bacterium KMM 3653]|uniref:DUF1311 domain-containing protein n=1 Tax=Harenicola maris TaxID=2841044 RepID=A0AAP2CK13_9RHOB|nr:DUF1311 domain-containing protein [Harenicola maris]
MPQQHMNYCAAEEFKALDKTLNAVWKRAKAQVAEADKYNQRRDGQTESQVLLESQRAWIKYRDLTCDIDAYQVRGGSLEPLLRSTCMSDLTERRTRFLAYIAEGEPGEQ